MEQATQEPPVQKDENQRVILSEAIVGPPLMTTLFAFFTKDDAPMFFPGAPMMAGALFTIVGLVLTIRTMKRNLKPI